MVKSKIADHNVHGGDLRRSIWHVDRNTPIGRSLIRSRDPIGHWPCRSGRRSRTTLLRSRDRALLSGRRGLLVVVSQRTHRVDRLFPRRRSRRPPWPISPTPTPQPATEALRRTPSAHSSTPGPTTTDGGAWPGLTPTTTPKPTIPRTPTGIWRSPKASSPTWPPSGTPPIAAAVYGRT